MAESRKKETFLVARFDQEQALKDFGFSNVLSFGLPFAYALKITECDASRLAKSLLIMPGLHATAETLSYLPNDMPYISYLSGWLDHFSSFAVCLHAEDIRRGRHQVWQRAGYSIELGADPDGESSLEDFARLLQRFEFATTNGLGSHLAYAAAAGCKVSLCGPSPVKPTYEEMLDQPFYRNRPDLAFEPKVTEAEHRSYIEAAGILVDPPEAPELTSWGKFEIGFQHLQTPERTRRSLTELQKRSKNRNFSLVSGLGAIVAISVVSRLVRGMRKLVRVWRLARLTENPSGRASLRVTVRNLTTLLFRRRRVSWLQFNDAEDKLCYRPGTTDLSNISQHFFDRELEEISLQRPSLIVDLGCYAGYSMRALYRKFPTARFVGVEPSPENFRIAQANLRGLQNITLIPGAVWSVRETLSLVKHSEGLWAFRAGPSRDGQVQVEGFTVREIIDFAGGGRADFIKMDIEGSEYRVLGENIEQFAGLCDVLAVEFHEPLGNSKRIRLLKSRATSHAGASITEVGEYTVFDFRSHLPAS